MSFATAALALKGLRQLAASKWLSDGNYGPRTLLPFPQKFDYQEDVSTKELPGGDVTADKSSAIKSATATIGWARMRLDQIGALLGADVTISGGPGSTTVVVKRRTSNIAPFFMWETRVNYVGPEFPNGEFLFKFYKGNIVAPPKISLQTEEYAAVEIQVTFYEDGNEDFYDYISNESGSPFVESSDATPPTIVSITPADNATGVALSATPVVALSEPCQKDASQYTLSKIVSTTNITEVPCEVIFSADGDEVTITPGTVAAPVALDASSVYNLRVGAGVRDLAGNLISGPTNSQFTTGT